MYIVLYVYVYMYLYKYIDLINILFRKTLRRR